MKKYLLLLSLSLTLILTSCGISAFDDPDAGIDGPYGHLPRTAPVASFIPEMAVFDLPMVFSRYDGDTIDQVLNDHESQFFIQLSKAYERRDLHLLGFLQNATYRLTTANKPLNTLADFKNLQIRTMENSNHILYANQIAISKASFDALPAEYQAALEQAVSEALAEMRPQLAQLDADNKQFMTEHGMTMIEYDSGFFQEILELDTVKALYDKINRDVGGLGATLQEALDRAA